MTAKTPKHTPAQLADLFRYDPHTGHIWWKQRARKRFTDRPVGHRDAAGYLRVHLDGMNYAVHRIAWALHHGWWPEGVIDHINRRKDDNRIGNLRDTTVFVNAHNRKHHPRKVNVYTGVVPRHNGWQTMSHLYGKRTYIGFYQSEEQAIAAAKASYAERERIYLEAPDTPHDDALRLMREAASRATGEPATRYRKRTAA